MVDLDRLSSVRTVQDMDDRGTVVTDDVMAHDAETVFPLQVAMGYRLWATGALTEGAKPWRRPLGLRWARRSLASG